MGIANPLSLKLVFERFPWWLRRDRLPDAASPGKRFVEAAALLGVLGIAFGVGVCVFAGELVDAERGMEILVQRNCLACHSLGDEGAGTAPDLGRRSIMKEYAPTGLAAKMWNHGPSMWEELGEMEMGVPPLGETEAEDLFAYFRTLRYFDLRGEAIRGKQLFAAKHCNSCHALEKEKSTGQQTAPPVSDWPALTDPIEWAHDLWNHSGAMLQEFRDKDVQFPTFSDQEMVDLLIYLQNLPPTRSKERGLVLSPTADGGKVFEDKGCASCHSGPTSISGRHQCTTGAGGVQTLTCFAASMWNHAPDMHERAERQGTALESVTYQEMTAIVSYLYEQGAFERPGNDDKGHRVFEKKGCTACHGLPEYDAPVLVGTRGRFSAAQMASAVWLHGPEMWDQMRRSDLKWPSFSAHEMGDLIAYLNSE
jgi:cytochrome c551/c552